MTIIINSQNVMIREENLPLKGRIREETASMSEIRRFTYVKIPVLEENVETRVVFVVKRFVKKLKVMGTYIKLRDS